MQRLTKQIGAMFDLDESSILTSASPLAKYMLLMAFWSVLWADSIFKCGLLLFILVIVAVFGRALTSISLFLAVIIPMVILGEILLSMFVRNNNFSADNVRFAIQIIILFSSPVVIFGNSTVMQHFYFWSNLLGGGLGASIAAFGRTVFSLRGLIGDTRDAYRIRGISPIRKFVPFLLSLQASIILFARTYADAMEIRDIGNIRGHGNLGEAINSTDVLMWIVAVLMPIIVFGL